MKPLSVVGPSDAGVTTVVEGLAERLAEQGRVATIEHLGSAPTLETGRSDAGRYREAGAARTCGITDAGGWVATGEALTLEDALAELAPSFDYALVAGESGADLPTVALGGCDHAGETLQAALDADAVDPEAVVDALEGVEPYETLESLAQRARESPAAEYAGAVATFTGRVRRKDDADDVPTERLEFEKYEGVADERMAAIRSDLRDREGVHEVLLHHRTGVVEAGEDIVHVVVLAGHRREAFRAVEDGIDRLKEEVPLFKKEITVEDAHWAHER
ncbi:MAG: molybdopterin synthase [Haloarculaceae archaeon]